MEAVSSSGIFTVASKRSARIEFIQICSLLPRRIMQMSSGMNNPEKAGNGRHFACSVPENSGNQSPPSLSKQNTIRNNILHHEYYYYFLFLIRYVFVCLVLLSTNSGSIVNSAYCCAGCNSSRDVQISSQLSFFLSFFWWFDFLFLSLSLSLIFSYLLMLMLRTILLLWEFFFACGRKLFLEFVDRQKNQRWPPLTLRADPNEPLYRWLTG